MNANEYWRQHNERVARKRRIWDNIAALINLGISLLVMIGITRFVILVMDALQTYVSTKGGCR